MTSARQHRSGDLVAVWVPDEEQEAIRDLARTHIHGIALRVRRLLADEVAANQLSN